MTNHLIAGPQRDRPTSHSYTSRYQRNEGRRAKQGAGGREIYRRELGENEVDQTRISPAAWEDMAAADTPESLLLAKEMAGEGASDDDTSRVISPKMKRALLHLTAETPQRVWRMLDWLPLEEAYAMRRYLLNGSTQQEIAEAFAVTKPAVHQRLYRALWRLRTLMDLAWDMSPEALAAAVVGHLSAADAKLTLAFWASRWSQSRTAATVGRRQSSVRDRLVAIEGELEGPARRQEDTKRVHWTLLQVRVRKLAIAPYMPVAGAMRMSGVARG